MIAPPPPLSRFGEGLELVEQQWLVCEINNHLEGVQGQPVDFEDFPRPEVPRFYRDAEQVRVGGFRVLLRPGGLRVELVYVLQRCGAGACRAVRAEVGPALGMGLRVYKGRRV